MVWRPLKSCFSPVAVSVLNTDLKSYVILNYSFTFYCTATRNSRLLQKKDGGIMISEKMEWVWGLSSDPIPHILDMLKKIYRDKLDNDTVSKVFLALAYSSNDGEAYYTKSYRSSKAIEKMLRKQTINLFTPNLFYNHYERTKENLRWLNALMLDYDGDDPLFSIREFAQSIEEKTGFAPHFVWGTQTPGHYQAAIIINPMTGTTKSIYLYEKIAKALAEDTNSDIQATQANHLFRLPKNRFLLTSEHPAYDIDDFKKWFNRTHAAKEEQRRRENGNLFSFRDRQILKHPAIQSLINCTFDGSRNHACFTLALLFYALGYDEDYTKNFLSTEWIEKANKLKREVFHVSEIRSCIKSAYSGKYAGPAKEYIEGLTSIEFPFSVTKARYERTKYNNKNETRTAIIELIRRVDGKVSITQEEIAKATGKAIRSVQRELAAMRNEGVIEYETKRGRYAGGTYYKLINDIFNSSKVVTEVKFDFSAKLA